MVLGGIGFAMLRTAPTAAADHETRRAKLLDELVEIDRIGKDTKRRDAVLAELEKLWED